MPRDSSATGAGTGGFNLDAMLAMLITIGMLAFNEERQIDRTIQSLLGQSVFRDRWREHESDEWEIVVVPNGCKDRTHEVALGRLTQGIPDLAAKKVRFRVESLAQAGKSNAWNELVHRIASPRTGVFVMMDADIEFGHVDTIHNCLGRLLQDDHVQVVVDLPLKDFTRKSRLTTFERISAGVSRMNLDARPGISGQFYCIRGSLVRQVWMPVGLSVEDGFLNAMVATNCFRSDPDPSRVVRAQDASHYFEGLVSLRKVIRHEVRLVMGTVLNCFLCWDTCCSSPRRMEPAPDSWCVKTTNRSPTGIGG